MTQHESSGGEHLRTPFPLPEPSPLECDFCRSVIAEDALYHRVTIGLNEEGPEGATSPGPTVEEVSELLTCLCCQPRVEAAVDGLLERLWALRDADASEEDRAPETLPEMDAPATYSTPFGLTTQALVDIGDEMLAVAARAHQGSPEGFALGVVFGRMLQSGHSVADIESTVRKIAEQTAATIDATEASA